MPKRIDYDERQHAVYSEGRALSDELARLWSGAFARWAPAHRPLAALDLGSGTGRFTPILAEVFGGPAYGVEPSERMRRQAAPHPNVRYLPGSAEAIPLPDRSCDVVLMFLVLHHVTDRRRAAAEIARVLRPGGRLLIRSAFTDRMPDLLWHHYFPAARRIELQVFPKLTDVTDVFEEAGMTVAGLERVRETMAPDLAAYTRRLRLRAISTFEHLTEDEIERGFAALDRAVAAHDVPGPITGDSDLLVLEHHQGHSPS
ncbi:class I SAM-dependent methyltransferase [Dactylosporangium darangshiense]|uniref:Methyltransferase type 11 domain-containing protein n=1 Tax=Dactylosporangium darangshiense TaxID=579108 RepID=A0ABP8DEZ4_9ACTN